MNMEQRMRFPVQDAADGIVLINAVPEIADMLGIPDEQALKSRDQEFSRRELVYKFRDVFVLDAYFSIAVIQASLSAENHKLYRELSRSRQGEIIAETAVLFSLLISAKRARLRPEGNCRRHYPPFPEKEAMAP